MTNAPRCEHCGLRMPVGAMFGPDDWSPWQPGGRETFTQFCPGCREHNPIATATRHQQLRTWQTMLTLSRHPHRRLR
jgi:hypothetical protein